MSDLLKNESPVAERSRRDFLKLSALGLAVTGGASVLAACNTSAAEQTRTATKAAPVGAGDHQDSTRSGATTGSHPMALAEIRATADQMDRHREEEIKAFPQKTAQTGNQLMESGMENGVTAYQRAGAVHRNPLSRLELPNDQDGVPFITQPPVKPGDSYT